MNPRAAGNRWPGKSIWKEILAAVLGGVVTAALIALVPSAFRWIVSPAVPHGAVMAFDLEQCPIGWSHFRAAGGRVVIGAGAHPTPPETTYALGAIGGEEKHTLTLKEIPPHSHTYHWEKDSPHECGLEGCHGHHEGMDSQTSTEGGGKPHENRPPFIALMYCKKN